MANYRTRALSKDPQDVSTQIQIRVPFWYRTALISAAERMGMNLTQFILYVLEHTVPPEHP